jgi:hypothetical protein
MLKWWKDDKGVSIRSHHFLSALNVLPNLNERDPLWIPEKTSRPYSNLRVIEIMRGILTYLYQAYHENPSDFMLPREYAGGRIITDYPCPEMRTSVLSAHSPNIDSQCRTPSLSFSDSTRKIEEVTPLH